MKTPLRFASETGAPRSYEEWRAAAIARDEITGNARWKEIDKSDLYDYASIRERMEVLQRLRATGDDLGLLKALDEGIHGNLGSMGHADMYANAEFGTKALITQYIDTVYGSLEHLVRVPDKVIAPQVRREFFERAQVCFGRSALLLSGGGIYGNFHVGVVKVLIEQDLLPNVISGSSAGSLVAAIVGTHERQELIGLLNEQHLRVETKRRTGGLQNGLRGLLPELDLKSVTQHIERLVPDMTMAEARERTGILINISVSPAQIHQMPRLLNAATTPDVLVRSAVLASCSVPGVFPPAMLVARDRSGETRPYMPERRWYDGSLREDIPAQRLSRLYGVNHCIVSQVNPFGLAVARHLGSRQSVMAPVYEFWHQTGLTMAQGWKDVAARYGRSWPGISFAINGLVSVMTQNYLGNITILPEIGLVKIWRGMRAPTKTELRELIAAGEKATWPKVEMIRNCTRIGRLLDQIVASTKPRSVRSK